ncbi:type I modular polyketide synthase [Sulfobacillus acidophilus TPY]|uniref:O-succinylbenzoate--CoA ligase n=1 Tax=Sulfobacillus acidophilus (strain ATCC 700253 / DSM 10332 / NAL) TaxID=679936 RepID=G8TXN6_SULAD|nr:type I modular polyketide synthase [Sulfobacillus acidophilus TPY]AEW04992.1 o-succinylbenzoate--CoA ligase [Sulfobacillus acidophilus DSM 10332]
MVTIEDYVLHGTDAQKAYLQGLTWPQVVGAVVDRAGDAIAVFDGPHTYRWRDWWTAAGQLAAGLHAFGIQKGDVVAVYLPNSWEFLVAHLGIAWVGAVMLPLHLAHGEHELRALLERVDARLIIMTAEWRGKNYRALGEALETPDRRVIWVGPSLADDLRWEGFMGSRHMSVPLARLDPNDPFVLLASSGTASSRPKICLHSHDGLLSNAWAAARDGKYQLQDVIISASPFSHAFGLLSVHLSAVTGHAMALLPYWDVSLLSERVQASRASVLFAVPAQLRDLVDQGPSLTLREVRTGGAAVPADLVEDVRRHLQAGVIVQWGMTEVGAGCYTRPDDDADVASRSVGRPCRGAEVRVVENGRDVEPGQLGELWYRSPYQFRGYYRDPELSRQIVDDEGWIHTGDLAQMNPDGTVQYRGRRTELINRGGLKFSALEVESLLTDLPGVSQLAVIAQPDRRLGERALLVVALKPGTRLELTDVRDHLAQKQLAKYKWPEELVVLNRLPTTPSGKIARARLEEAVRTVQKGWSDAVSGN